MIRYVTRRQPGTFPRYLGDRASRIYSVAIPALLLTLVCDSISKHVNPGFYSNWILDFRHPLRRILLNLLFCGQIWKFLRDPLSNSPFWSINYEVAYYILYGCFFYLWGSRRWIALILVGLFFGPWILYLAPLWIAGCWLCDAHTAWNSSGKMLRNLLILTLTTSVIFAAHLSFAGPLATCAAPTRQRAELRRASAHQTTLLPIRHCVGCRLPMDSLAGASRLTCKRLSNRESDSFHRRRYLPSLPHSFSPLCTHRSVCSVQPWFGDDQDHNLPVRFRPERSRRTPCQHP